MKKIFSIICAVAVAISVPLLAYTPKVAHAEEVVNPLYQREYDNDPYVYNTNLSTVSDTYYAYLNWEDVFPNFIEMLTVTEVPQNYLYDTVFTVIDGTPFELFEVQGAYYKSNFLVEANISFSLFPLVEYGYMLNGVFNRRGVLCATPTIVTLSDVENLPFDYLPFSTVNMFDMVLFTCSTNTNTSGVFYYPWAFYALGGRLYSNAFLSESYLNGVVPYFGFSFDDENVDSQFCLGMDIFTYTTSDFGYMNNHHLVRTRNSNNNGSSVMRVFSLNSYKSLFYYSPIYYNEYPVSLLQGVFESKFNMLSLDVLGEISYQNGYLAGYNSGHASGYKEGYSNGYDEGYKMGSNLSGLSTIKAQEYNRGFRDGMRRAEQDGGSFGFVSLITTIADSQLMLLNSFLDFNFLGFNMLTFFKSILTVCVVIIVLKFVL